MKEYIVDLWPNGRGLLTKARVFASNQAHAIRVAKEMYPNYRTGSVKEVK